MLKIFCPAEFNTLYHPDLRQDIFVKDDHYYLNVPRIGTYAVYDTLDCTIECLSNPSCFSLNLAASKGADGKLWCELLSSEKYSNPGEYKRNESSHHFSIKVPLLFSLTPHPPPPPRPPAKDNFTNVLPLRFSPNYPPTFVLNYGFSRCA